ncbi:MAG: MEDS domain-containing protein [Haloferacaceae archaeon]
MSERTGAEPFEIRRRGRKSELVDALDALDVHDHLALIYETRDEQLDAVIPFVHQGLERSEKCIYIVDDNTAETVFDAMRADGIDVDDAIDADQLVVTGTERSYLRDGYFDPDEMFDFLADAEATAKAEGFDALRVTGEMTWTLGGDPGTDRLMEYEARLNDFLDDHDVLAICQYNRERFADDVVVNVIRTHPKLIYNYAVLDNFYYEEPETFLEGAQSSAVERMLRSLAERNYVDQQLTEQRERLSVRNRVLRHNLRNDMTILLGQAELLRDRVDPEHRDLVETILDVGNRLVERSNQLRRIDATLAGEPELETHRLSELLAPVTETLETEFPDASVTVDVDDDPEVYATAHLGTAIWELVKNAVEHNDRREPQVDVSVVEPDDSTVEVRIADDGPPIPEHIRQLVAGEADIDPLYHSEGLGLWVTNWLVNRALGRIRFEANDARGNVVVVELQRR